MSKTDRIAFFSLAAFVWVYLGFRAVNVPLIHDEVVTFFVYIKDANFIPPWAYWDANNHLLNSALGAIFHYLFGSSNFVVRLASWLSFMPLVYFTYKISQTLNTVLSKWTFILPLLTAPFFIEFFGLTRGYGMAMSWFLGVLYWSMRYAKNPNTRSLLWVSAFGILSTLSSLSLIVSILIIYGWVFLHQILVQQKLVFISFLKWTAIFILPQAPLVYYVFLLKEKNLLYYGGDDFIKFTLKPFARFFFNDANLWWVIILPFLVIFSAWVFQILKSGWRSVFENKTIFAFALVLSVLAVFLQNFVLGVNYPEDRAALYFFPLFVGAWATIPTLNLSFIKPVLFLFILWFPIDFITTLNTTHSKLWRHEHVPMRFSQKVNSFQKNGYAPTISTYFLRYYIWDFNQFNTPGTHSTAHIVDYPNEWADFIMIDSNRIKDFSTTQYQKLDFDSISGNTLLQRMTPITETIKRDTALTDVAIESTYTNILEFNGATWGQKPMALYYDIDLNVSSNNMHLLIVSTLFDSTGSEVFTAKSNLDQIKGNWKTDGKQKVKLFLPPFPETAGRFVTYVYNPKNEKHQLIKLKCSLAEISHPKKE